MYLEIFDVEHGACALLTAENNTRIMIDCGHNTSTSWRPGTYLRQKNITALEMLAITNYDEDHVSGANDLFDNVHVQWLWRNTSVSASTIKKLKTNDGMGPGIERLVREIETRFSGNATGNQPPQFQGLTERQVFCNHYPAFDDENNLSMAVFLKCHGIGVMFTGDLEKAGIKALLANAGFKAALQQTNIYIASHHGRESGCAEELLQHLTKTFYVVISDKGYAHATQETLPFYQKIAKGGPFRGATRYILTTRNDGPISFQFRADGWGPY